MDRPTRIPQPAASLRRRALVSPLVRLVKILRREAQAPVEILPPDGRCGNIVGLQRGAGHSVEARADAFASLFLNADPRDLRDPHSGPR
jgi:hypothetical protein